MLILGGWMGGFLEIVKFPRDHLEFKLQHDSIMAVAKDVLLLDIVLYFN